jgi:hypothetical protein
MDHEHGELISPLQFAQQSQRRCNLAAGVLIDAMQAYERIQHQQRRFEFFDGMLEPVPIGLQIQPHGGGGDHLYVQLLQAHLGGDADALEPSAYDVQSVFGRVQQHPSGGRDREVPQAGGPGGDRDRQIQSQEGFAALGLAA